jgi:predicted Zn-dependent peptidase
MTTETMTAPEPARARPVFSTEDFALLRTAVLSHLQQVQDSPDSVKYSNLYHRLGRLVGD